MKNIHYRKFSKGEFVIKLHLFRIITQEKCSNWDDVNFTKRILNVFHVFLLIEELKNVHPIQ